MTLTIDLPAVQTAALEARARAMGISVEMYARQILERTLVPEWLQGSWESAKHAGIDGLSMDEIDAEIAAARISRRTSAA